MSKRLFIPSIPYAPTPVGITGKPTSSISKVFNLTPAPSNNGTIPISAFSKNSVGSSTKLVNIIL